MKAGHIMSTKCAITLFLTVFCTYAHAVAMQYCPERPETASKSNFTTHYDDNIPNSQPFDCKDLHFTYALFTASGKNPNAGELKCLYTKSHSSCEAILTANKAAANPNGVSRTINNSWDCLLGCDSGAPGIVWKCQAQSNSQLCPFNYE